MINIWNPKLGVFGNFERIAKCLSRTESKTTQNGAEILEAEANMVEAVVDEYYAVIGEERDEENV